MVFGINEEAALDVWAEVHGDDGYISIKLSSNDMAQRPYKQAHIPASLKPTLAYSMVRLSKPHPDDVFLDAMCGAGTILLERALMGRYRYLIGGDVSTEALDATVTNFGRKHQPRQFFPLGMHAPYPYNRTQLIKSSVIFHLVRLSETFLG